MNAPSERKAVLGLVFDAQNHVLLIRRTNESRWLFPGGKVEPGESEEAAVVREVEEESGVRCRAEASLGRRIHPETQWELSYWLCSAASHQISPRNPREIAEARFFSARAALTLLGDALYAPVRAVLSSRI